MGKIKAGSLTSDVTGALGLSGVSAGIATLVAGWGAGFDTTLDIQFHDTYYVFALWHLFFLLFISGSIFILTSVRLIRLFRSSRVYIVMAVVAALLVLVLSWYMVRLNPFPFGGEWVIYPPLSAMENSSGALFPPNRTAWTAGHSVVLFSQALMVGLAAFCFRKGRLGG